MGRGFESLRARLAFLLYSGINPFDTFKILSDFFNAVLHIEHFMNDIAFMLPAMLEFHTRDSGQKTI